MPEKMEQIRTATEGLGDKQLMDLLLDLTMVIAEEPKNKQVLERPRNAGRIESSKGRVLSSRRN